MVEINKEEQKANQSFPTEAEKLIISNPSILDKHEKARKGLIGFAESNDLL